MKRRLMGLLTVGAALFIACNSEKDFYDSNSLAAQKEAQYEHAFIQRYGKIAPDQDWGFGTVSNSMKAVRGVDANANNWGTYVNVPMPLTEAQIQVVSEWFRTNKTPKGIAVNWSDFFAQQVSSLPNGYAKHMNYLTCGDGNEHINNFNAGTCSENGNVCYDLVPNESSDQNNWKKYHSDRIQFMVNSSTSTFGYYNSLDSKDYHDYVIIPGDRIDPLVAGMYFVGFDYQANGQADNQKVSLDGYYNDWIIKITPGIYKDAHRIIAEDLGAIGDFDFNDAVFDVAFQSDASIVTLQAAGGILPLYIEVGDQSKEVHDLFGVSHSTMVNTGKVSKAPVIFRLPPCNDINEVKIRVENEVVDYYLNAECGKAPKKICVPTTYEWTKEQERIDNKYPKFKDWVGDPSINWLDSKN